MHGTNLNLNVLNCSQSGMSVYLNLKMFTEKHLFQENLHFYMKWSETEALSLK